jgi:hypothetical protein
MMKDRSWGRPFAGVCAIAIALPSGAAPLKVSASDALETQGHNGPDYTFIPGGMVPGALIIKPDFPAARPG